MITIPGSRRAISLRLKAAIEERCKVGLTDGDAEIILAAMTTPPEQTPPANPAGWKNEMGGAGWDEAIGGRRDPDG